MSLILKFGDTIIIAIREEWLIDNPQRYIKDLDRVKHISLTQQKNVTYNTTTTTC